MSDHYHYGYADERHDHRGQYAEERHDHDVDYAGKHHRHYEDESTARGLREDLSRAEERIRELEDGLRELSRQLDGALTQVRVLDRLRPSCVICLDATADRQTVRGPACTDCAGDQPDDGPDPERPETWAFPGPEEFDPPPEAGDEGHAEPAAACECNGGPPCDCPDCGHPDCVYRDADEPEAEEYDPGPEVDDEGGMSEYHYTLPEDYKRGHS